MKHTHSYSLSCTIIFTQFRLFFAISAFSLLLSYMVYQLTVFDPKQNTYTLIAERYTLRKDPSTNTEQLSRVQVWTNENQALMESANENTTSQNTAEASQTSLKTNVLVDPQPDKAEQKPSATEVDERGSEEVACKFQIINPWDKQATDYLKEQGRLYGINGVYPREFECGYVQPYLSHVVEGRFISINETEWSNFGTALNSTQTLKCFYAAIIRPEGDDENLTLSEYRELLPGMKATITTDAASVACYVDNVMIYNNTHPVFSEEQLNKTKKLGDESEENLSLLLLIVDSASLAMFQRQLPDTYKYITEKMGYHVFKGYNKVGDNSFINMVPILTGRRSFKHGWNMPEEFNGEDVYNIKFDHWPLIWKEFSEKGYVTMYNEDTPQWGLFTYYMQGFINKPVDHYFRPYWLSLHYSQLRDRSKRFCNGNDPKPQLQLEITKNMYLRYQGKLKFAYTFLCEASHNYEPDLGREDYLLVDFLKYMHEGNWLNKTAVILMADHGLRFGELRKTLLGLLEERKPIYSMWFPDWFYKKHPHIQRNLKLNTMRLTSNFDVHETMEDILHSKFNDEQMPLSERGLSMLYPIPANRTCVQAGIPVHYCTCSLGQPVDVADQSVVFAAEFLVFQLNEMLLPIKDLCTEFELAQVLRAEMLEPNQQVVNGHVYYEKENQTELMESQIKMISLGIEVKPGGGQFEATVTVNTISGTMSLNGDGSQLSRLNAYGNTSHCANDYMLRKICYCKVQLA